VHWAGLRYGTALLARQGMGNPQVTRFSASPPTPRKGFVTARTHLDGHPVDVVSVHLDFARATVRSAQLQELADHLASRGTPVVVMGDLNDDPAGHAVGTFRAQTGLQGLDDDGITFPKLRRRIDAILVSEELRVTNQRVLPVDLSDHRPVVADIAWAT
jgi:endonuclease/exonuclease/phosphatase family metal-dependent hydrolase